MNEACFKVRAVRTISGGELKSIYQQIRGDKWNGLTVTSCGRPGRGSGNLKMSLTLLGLSFVSHLTKLNYAFVVDAATLCSGDIDRERTLLPE